MGAAAPNGYVSWPVMDSPVPAKPPENRKLKGVTQPGGLEAVQRTSTATPSTENDFDELSLDSDLPQRPRATSPP